MSADLKEKKQNFENGATRSETGLRYDLVPAVYSERGARRWGLGAVKHGENNWKGGGVSFIVACVNHLEAHLVKFKSQGNATDDNLGAILWNAGALAWFEENKPKEYASALSIITGKDL